MSLLSQTTEAIAVDVSNQSNWLVEIEDTDENGDAISHEGDEFRAELRDNDDELVLELDDYISLKPAEPHVVVVNVPWSEVADIEPGEYVTTIVRVIDADNREEFLSLVFRHTNGPTRS
jgi:hypothetical protein